jgi:acetyl-CoA carboxylase biotin carboxyl carrier protein
MNLKEISELIKLVDKSNLAEVEVKLEGVHIKIRHDKYYRNAVSPSALPMQTLVHAPVHSSPAPTPQSGPPTQSGGQSVSDETPKSVTNLIEIKSPMVGTFYRSSGPDKPPFVQVGDMVQKGSPVCIIEAMKLFNEIESEVSGKIVKVMVEDASPVEYDQILFLVEP